MKDQTPEKQETFKASFGNIQGIESNQDNVNGKLSDKAMTALSTFEKLQEERDKKQAKMEVWDEH